MNELIKIVQMYQKTEENYLFEEIIDYLYPCIKHQTAILNSFYQDDLSQEIINKIFKAIKKFHINLNDLNVYDKSYYSEFNKAYFNYNLDDYEQFEKIRYEYQLFINEKQFLNYIKRLCINERISFYKGNIEKNENLLSLNVVVEDNTELLDLVEIPFETTYEDNLEKLDEKDRFFIDCFISDGVLLKNKDVAKKLNLTPQGVCMRKKRIKEKYSKKI